MIESKIYSSYMLSTCNFDFTFEKDYPILSNYDLTKYLFDPVDNDEYFNDTVHAVKQLK